MVANLLSKVFGTRNERLIRTMTHEAERINALEHSIVPLSDAELRVPKTLLSRLATMGIQNWRRVRNRLNTRIRCKRR